MHTVVFLPWGRGIICRKIYFYRICVFRKWEGGRGEQPKEGRVWEGIAPSNARELGNLYTFTEHVSPSSGGGGGCWRGYHPNLGDICPIPPPSPPPIDTSIIHKIVQT